MIDIYPYLTSCRTFEELTSRYMQALRGGSPDDVNVAIVLKEYLHKESLQFLTFVEKQEQQIFDMLSSILPCDLSVYGRKKSFYSYVQKLKGVSDVRDVKDIYAIRAVLNDSVIGNESAIIQCYIATKALIKFYQSKDFTPDVLKVSGVTGQLDEGVDIYIPDITLRPDFMAPYLRFMKDYILNPKPNGYQSIHSRFQQGGRSIDAQIRTSSMDEFSEFGCAAHDGIYKPPVTYEYLKNIHIDGLEYDKDGNILVDVWGIFKPLAIGQILQSVA